MGLDELYFILLVKKFETARFPPTGRRARPPDRSEHLDNLGSQSPVCHVTRAGAAAANLCAAVVSGRLCFPRSLQTPDVSDRSDGFEKGRAGEAVWEERKAPPPRLHNTEETETWCADTAAPTPTENRIQLVIPVCGGRTRRKSASL